MQESTGGIESRVQQEEKLKMKKQLKVFDHDCHKGLDGTEDALAYNCRCNGRPKNTEVSLVVPH